MSEIHNNFSLHLDFNAYSKIVAIISLEETIAHCEFLSNKFHCRFVQSLFSEGLNYVSCLYTRGHISTVLCFR